MKQKKDLDRQERVQQELYRFFDVSRDLMCVASHEGYFLRVNPTLVRVLGYSEEELLSRPYTDFIHPEDRPVTRKEAEVIAESEGEKAQDTFENRYVCKDGSVK